MACVGKIKDNTLKHLGTSVLYTIVSVIVLGLIYPLVMTGISQLIFPAQANGSMIYADGKPIGSAIIGQLWTKPQYFHGRPSAAGKGYDPTATGATNDGPTSKKLIDSTKAAIAALKKENPDATIPIPIDLVTSSGSGIDPDISPGCDLSGAAGREGTEHPALKGPRSDRPAYPRPGLRISRRAAGERPGAQPRARRRLALGERRENQELGGSRVEQHLCERALPEPTPLLAQALDDDRARLHVFRDMDESFGRLLVDSHDPFRAGGASRAFEGFERSGFGFARVAEDVRYAQVDLEPRCQARASPNQIRVAETACDAQEEP